MNYIDIKSNKAHASIDTKESQLRFKKKKKKKKRVSQAVVVHPSNPSTLEAEAAPGQRLVMQEHLVEYWAISPGESWPVLTRVL